MFGKFKTSCVSGGIFNSHVFSYCCYAFVSALAQCQITSSYFAVFAGDKTMVLYLALKISVAVVYSEINCFYWALG